MNTTERLRIRTDFATKLLSRWIDVTPSDPTKEQRELIKKRFNGALAIADLFVKHLEEEEARGGLDTLKALASE